MPRFPAYEKNIVALGKLLAEASVNPELKQKLIDDPAAELRRIGLPEKTAALFNFKVVQEDDHEKPPVVLPYRLNEERLASGEEQYLSQLADLIPPNTLN
ncbi:hypothetical protein [uncultured Roseibium sp.]|uniref:hypothetical protein n=1 Tax=uncultured Roseibium sp. TaxID=1936171 RepID=UPI00259A189E|nr:hypothetical protein [uncultured Roseibium sp.]